jgi:hypothetical protein
LPIDKKILNKGMSDLFSRYDILQTYLEINEWEKVPEKYRKPVEIAKTCMNYYNSEEGEISTIALLGSIAEGDSVYYAFEFLIKDDEEKIKYISVTGPFIQNRRIKNLDDYMTNSDWEPKAKDWRKQAANLIKTMKEW